MKIVLLQQQKSVLIGMFLFVQALSHNQYPAV